MHIYQLIPRMLPLLIKYFEDLAVGLVFRAGDKMCDEVSLTDLSCLLGSYTVELTWTLKSHNFRIQALFSVDM